MRAAIVLALAAGCGPSGVLVVSSWQPSVTAQNLFVETTVGSETAIDETIMGPMQSPYRLLVRSPSQQPLIVALAALDPSGRHTAAARLGVTPKDQVVTVYVELLAISNQCGNGNLDDGEMCDDGNREDRDGCTNACQCARCGDGILHAFATTPPNGMCPNEPIEECDDGNTVSGDGCSATCTRE